MKLSRCCWFHERLGIVCDPSMALCETVEKAKRGIEFTYPWINWERQTEETEQAYTEFEQCIEGYFLTTPHGASLDDVKRTWKRYYKACIPF